MEHNIKVTDARRKYPTKIYRVDAASELLAYGLATEQFIKDNNHPPRKSTQRMSQYYARFWNEVVS